MALLTLWGKLKYPPTAKGLSREGGELEEHGWCQKLPGGSANVLTLNMPLNSQYCVPHVGFVCESPMTSSPTRLPYGLGEFSKRPHLLKLPLCTSTRNELLLVEMVRNRLAIANSQNSGCCCGVSLCCKMGLCMTTTNLLTFPLSPLSQLICSTKPQNNQGLFECDSIWQHQIIAWSYCSDPKVNKIIADFMAVWPYYNVDHSKMHISGWEWNLETYDRSKRSPGLSLPLLPSFPWFGMPSIELANDLSLHQWDNWRYDAVSHSIQSQRHLEQDSDKGTMLESVAQVLIAESTKDQAMAMISQVNGGV